MVRRITVTCLAVLLASCGVASAQPVEPRVRFDGHTLVEVELLDERDMQRMLAISEDHWSCSLHLGPVAFRVSPERMDDLVASGLAFKVLMADIQPMLDAEQARLAQRGGDFFDDFRTYAEISSYVNELTGVRPGQVLRNNLGNSLQGQQIFAIEIRGGGDATGRPAVIFSGTQHAREWLSPMTVMYIADKLVRDYGNDPRITALLDACTVHIVPIVNPDGYQYSWNSNRLWRKNRRVNSGGSVGVDLNRNWGYEWGGDGSSGSGGSETYRGVAPFSEPETRAVRDYITARPQIVGHIDFHTYGQLILSQWGFEYGEPDDPDGTTIRYLNDVIRGAIAQQSGVHYEAGPAGETLYLASGVFPDWSYGARGIFAWTIELRPTGAPGFTPGPEFILPTGAENLDAVLAMSAFVISPIAYAPASWRPIVIPAGEPSTVRIRLTELRDTLNASSVRLRSRIGTSGPFDSAVMTAVGGGEFEGALPAAACDATVEYYFEYQSVGATVYTYPSTAPIDLLSAVARPVYFADDMEQDRGWTVGAPTDTATSGIWARQNPRAIVAAGALIQSEDDRTDGGVRCYVTDGRLEPLGDTYDVSGGATSLTTPALDLSGAIAPRVRWAQWYVNASGGYAVDDVFVVQASADGGATWATVQTFGIGGSGPGWFEREASLSGVITPSANVRLRFVASDFGANSRVEAAIDDLMVYDLCAPIDCDGDLNGDGQRDLADLSALLAAFSTCSADPGYDAAADLDASGCVDLADLSALLTVFGTPCE